MTRPRSNQFGTYFRALHGYDPFPWQRRLVAAILEGGSWPGLLDIPTGLGKTSAIDVALFVLAVRPDIAPRRTILVVDRRVVVDQAAEHARRIQRTLGAASDGILGSIAAALRSLWGGSEREAPFEVAVLRGGMPRDEAWAHRPDRPVVALSTVDQVGSRLLFRGYGVTPGMAPVHAGLLGHDALLLLDEVQLSTAFAETLRGIDERWRGWRERDHELGADVLAIPNRWAFVRMSATPVGGASKDDARFTLDDEDRAHPVVQRRLRASKLATLAEPITTPKGDPTKAQLAVVTAFAEEALRHLSTGIRRLVVIVNRVVTARQIHERLKQLMRDADVVLLTGRMRPLDRDAIFGDAEDPATVAGRVTAGAPRGVEQRPVVVISTQTLEAGADLDFDALITECASIDALRQRFGRLDRRGELEQSRATILIRKDQTGDAQDDPVYGPAVRETWRWLEAKAGKGRVVDFGLDAFPQLPKKAGERETLCSPVRHAPVLLPAHLDAWAQTNPRGEPDPDIALWLHGAERGVAEIRVVWRADLELAGLEDETRDEELEEYASASLALVPPSSLESISVPLAAFRDWIRRAPGPDFSDVEGSAGLADAGRDDQEHAARPFIIAGKAGARLCRDPARLNPDATVVIPAAYGGIRDGNWNPEATDPVRDLVRDLGDLAQLLHRGRPVLRLVPGVLCPTPAESEESGDHADANDDSRVDARPTWLELPASFAPTIPVFPEIESPDFEPRVVVLDWLAQVRDAGSETWRFVVDLLLAREHKLRVVDLGLGRFAAVGQKVRSSALDAHRKHVDPTSDIVNDDNDDASYIGQELTLERHLSDVERWARSFAQNLQLPDVLASDLALAARLHDLGKADPRFQQMLHGGSAVRMAASSGLLAKSRGDAGDRVTRERARERAGYPRGYRHELLSVALLEANAAALDSANDRELVLHLIGSHHGWCRPFAPAVHHGPHSRVTLSFDGQRYDADAAHGLAAVDSGVADRYWLLTERYGWWTLAWFEALVRLADHRASEEVRTRAEPNGLVRTSAASPQQKAER